MSKQRKLPKALTTAETNALLSSTSNPRDRLMLTLMLEAGLRATEAAKLQLENVAWEEQLLRVTGKGNKEAEVAISRRLKEALESALQARPPQATHNYILWNKRQPDKPIGRHAIFKLVRNTAKKAGITRTISPHMLRHTFVTDLYRSTGDIGKAQKAARHSRIETTTIYTHLTTEDQRKDFDQLDRRPWYIKLWSNLKPDIRPSFFQEKRRPFFIGETIGRAKEITELRKNLRVGIHTILIGERGTGRKHLLRQLEDTHLFRLDSLNPLRENLVNLCQKLHDRNLLSELPTGRSSTPFIEVLRSIDGDDPFTLVIESLNEAGNREIQALQKLANRWTIFATIDRKQKPKLNKIFFGNCSTIDLHNLNKNETLEFVKKTSATMNVPDPKAYYQFIYTQSEGNPQAIMDLIEMTRRTGNFTPHHTGVQKVLPATPFIALFLMLVFASRYSASALSEPSLKIIATLLIISIAPLIVFDKILKEKNK